MSNTNTNKQTVRSRPDQSGFSGNTKTLFLLAAISTCFIATAFSQAPAIEWQNTIGGSSYESLYSLEETSDGGYILGGMSNSGISGDKTEASLGGIDYWVMKLNGSGSIEWQNTIGGSGDDVMLSIQQTADGGYILGGYSYSGISGDKTEASSGLSDYWVVKLSTTGGIEWQNTIGGSNWDFLISLQQTSDGGYIVSGSSYSGISGDKTEANLGEKDYWVVKLNSTGMIVWQNSIGGNNEDVPTSLQQTAEGGYIVGGYSYSGISGDKTEASSGSSDYWVVKLNSSGAIEWQNTIGGSNSDWLESIQQTSDGGYILAGSSYSEISGDKTEANVGECDKGYCSADYWVMKLNSAGEIEWQNDMGGTDDDAAYSIQPTSDGGYILGGFSDSDISGDKTEACLGDFDYWVMKLNDTGTIEWQNIIGGNRWEELHTIRQTSDGGYILGGHSASDLSGDKTEANMGSLNTADYWVIKLAAPLSCDIPTGEFTSKITATTVKTNWNAVNAANKYKVRYKPTGTNTWTTLSVNVNYKKLTNLSPSTQYDWQAKSICTLAGLGKSDWSPTQTVTTASLKPGAQLPQLVFEVYPNPFTSSAIVTFSIQESSNILIELFDMAGRKLQTILNENVEAGSHEVRLDRGHLPAGMYVLKMKTPSSITTQSIIIQ